MKRHLILSDQQLISLLDLLGYDPLLTEEVQYRCAPDGSCEPMIVTSITILRIKTNYTNCALNMYSCNPGSLFHSI